MTTQDLSSSVRQSFPKSLVVGKGCRGQIQDGDLVKILGMGQYL